MRIAIVSQKGGVGKTTVTLNLGLALAQRGRRTLIVDLDPQGGIGHSLAKQDAELRGLADLLMGQATAAEAIVQTKLQGLSLLPRGRLDPVDACGFEQVLHAPGVLEKALADTEGGFDTVLLDTPSGLGMPTRAALRVADFALVPVKAEPLSIRSVAQLLAVIEHVRATENPRLALLGLLPTIVDRDAAAAMDVMVELWTGFGAVLETVIPRAEVFATASQAGVPLDYLGGPVRPEARRFELLAEELTTKMIAMTGKGTDDAERPQRQLL